MQRRIGDVCISWENEAFRAIDKLGADKFEMVTPSVSILTEPPVAVVDKVVQRRGTERVARAYLEYLYSSERQEIGARHHFRPRDPAVAALMRGSGSTRAADSSATNPTWTRTMTRVRSPGWQRRHSGRRLPIFPGSLLIAMDSAAATVLSPPFD